MGKGPKVPDYGVEIWSGLMGSGKSYMAVRRVLEFIISERRPVFTNLPLRWRVVRQYLRNRGREMGADAQALANLVQPLDEEHFRRFLLRQYQKHQYRESLVSEARRRGLSFRQGEFERRWRAEHGDDLWRDRENPDGSIERANWILPMSLIVVDEGHHWFPNISFPGLGHLKGKEIPELMFYLTMIRHHLHWLWIISQKPEQVSKRFRDLCYRFTDVRQRGEDVVGLGLRFKHLGINAFAYVTHLPEDDGRTGEDRQPLADETVFYKMRWNRWYFRLYDSFTHMGSVRRMRRAIEEVRREMGLGAEGVLRSLPGESGSDEESEEPMRLVKWGFRLTLLAVVFAIGVFVGVDQVGKRMVGQIASGLESVEAATREAAKGEVVPSSVSDVIEKWQSFNSQSVRVDNQVVKIGDAYAGATLLAIDVRQRFALWAFGGDVWLWRWGHEAERISSLAEFQAYLAGSRRAGAG